jgi:trans-aconitate 2-methyltransferase
VTDAWNPEQYDRFRDERREPFTDLLALVRPRANMRVVDLGCGSGELTKIVHERLGARETLGIDSSEAMLARARGLAGDGLGFAAGDIGEFAPTATYDLIFSNAALHWVPDHPALFARLRAGLVDGGQLAVHVPANFDHASHRVANEVAAESPFREALQGWQPPDSRVLEPAEYAALLARLGFVEQHVRLQVYGHRLAAPEEIVEWVKATLFTDYRRRLPAELYERFVARYRQCLLARVEDTRPHFFSFKRILLWARL